MSLLGLFPGEDDNRLDQLSRGQGGEPPGPGFFEGSLTAVPQGVEHGAALLGQAAGDSASGLLTKLLQPLYESQFQYGGGVSGGVPPLIARNPQDIQRDNEQATARMVKQYEQDPRTNGFVSQILFGLSDVATRMAPAAVTGPAAPFVAPALVGGTTGYDVKKQLQDQGVDETTANKMALTQGAFSAAGVSLPFGLGKTLLTKLATGAITNTGFGMADRATSATILRDAGYDKMADQYQVLDHQALVTDAIMGTFFGGMAHLHSLPPSVADLALKSSEALHVEHATDGVPVSPQAREDHLFNFGESLRAALNGDEPANLRDVRTVPDTAQEAARAQNAQTLAKVVAETSGEPVESMVRLYHGGEDIQPGDRRFLTPQESYARGYAEKDGRTSAKVFYVDVPANHPEVLAAGKSFDDTGASVRAPINPFEASAELTSQLRELPRPITNERRASVISDTRLNELNAKYDSGAPLDAAEMSEMIKLQRDRALNARVGQLPIRGVLSREGANVALQNQSFSHMTIVDASDFKPINDRFGHPVGDQVIQHIGQTLRRFAPEGAVVEHRGGDEFLIHHDTEDAGHQMVQKVNELLALQKIHALDEAGNILDTKNGVLLAHGTGTNEHDIETKLQLDKAAQKSAGVRVGERDQPRPSPDARGVDQRFAQGRGQSGDGGTGRDAAVSEPAVPRLDPETAEAVAAAERALADNPRLTLPADEVTGAEPRAGMDALKAALADITDGQTDADLTKVAAACFARTL